MPVAAPDPVQEMEGQLFAAIIQERPEAHADEVVALMIERLCALVAQGDPVARVTDPHHPLAAIAVFVDTYVPTEDLAAPDVGARVVARALRYRELRHNAQQGGPS